ncbi:divalent cation tolerance protein CutA [Ruminococcaceae bacterium OttesenSCG-928-I18]|nr:divalent cation tolerance protein CutA [Ruminococcaceae bacterium OttesenSCG-928-I18]
MRYVKIEVYAPKECLEAIRQAVHDQDADREGNYDMVCSYHPVCGSWRPLQGSTPYLGTEGQLCVAEEYKMEFRCEEARRYRVVEAIRQAHPYEEPVIHCLPLMDI